MRIKKIFKWCLVILLVPVFLLFVWAGVNVFYKTDIPPPLWTEADLPIPPPAEENGWVMLSNELERDPMAFRVEYSDALFDFIGEAGFRANDAKEIKELCKDMEPVRGELTQLQETNNSYKKYQEAASYPFFAAYEDPTKYLHKNNPVYTIFDMAKLEDVYILDSVCRGDLMGAINLTSRSLKAYSSYVTSVSSVISELIAVTVLRARVQKAAYLVDLINDAASPLTGDIKKRASV